MTDSVRVELDFGSGVTLTTANYVLSGPNQFIRTGMIAIGDQDSITATFNNLPAGTGYDVVVVGSASDDTDNCRGETMFDVQPSMNAVVQIQLVCTGLASVTADINVCPVIDSVSVLPAEVHVGASVQLVAAAHDADNGPSPLSASWTASSGTLSNTSPAGATFTCSQVGTAQIGLTVSDGSPAPSCADSVSVSVTCTQGGS
ncbi:MAG TPA: hypothetical protein VHL80_05715 [Polyangia bacterium]|nr:hypothetical protein [Polyangia bacterium]